MTTPHMNDVMSDQDARMFIDQSLITLLKRLADKDGKVVIPVSELDATGDVVVDMVLDQQAQIFTSQVKKKH